MLCATLASGGIGLTTSPPLPAAPVAGSPYPTAPPSKGSWARFLRIPEQWASLPSKHGELFTQVRHNLPWETRVAPPSRATEPTSHPPQPCSHPVPPRERTLRGPTQRAAPPSACCTCGQETAALLLCPWPGLVCQHGRERGPLPHHEAATETADGSEELVTEHKARRAPARKAGGLRKLNRVLFTGAEGAGPAHALVLDP